MNNSKRSDKNLTLYHILPSERACLLVENLLSPGQVVSRMHDRNELIIELSQLQHLNNLIHQNRQI